MAVRCASCGEELLGAVNRCWRCGTKIESRQGEMDRPPVRQSPLTHIVEPEVVSRSEVAQASPAREPLVDEESPSPGDARGAALSDDILNEPPTEASQPKRRIGSPFAGVHASPAAYPPVKPVAPWEDTPRRPSYPKNPAAAGGAVAALVLGLLSLASSFFTIGALFIALVGLAVGVWGVSSDRRGQAIVGLLLCCIALAISGFGAASLLYELRYGISPWDTPTNY